MNMELNYLAKKLFNKDSFRELSAVELDELLGKYPYSALLHFLYTRKLKDKNAFGYPDAVAKSALYFSNPHWLNHQINDHDESRLVQMPAESLNIVSEEIHVSVETIQGMTHNYENDMQHNATDAGLPATSAGSFEEQKTESPMNVEMHNKEPVRSPDFEHDQEFPDDHSNIRDNGVKEMGEETGKVEVEAEGIASESEDFEITGSSGESKEAEMQTRDAALQEAGSTDPVPESDIEKPVEEPLVPIEPLFSIDYFASQGIRLTSEEETKDKLGKSLKSFTEWLKSMKRLHPEKMAESMDATTEKNIQSEAEHSNQETEVTTETMAQVLTKQGRRDKAIELYEKLSLINPAKSAYFAAKIQELKAT